MRNALKVFPKLVSLFSKVLDQQAKNGERQGTKNTAHSKTVEEDFDTNEESVCGEESEDKNDPDWDILNTDSNEGDDSEIPSEIPLSKNLIRYCIMFLCIV